MTQPSSCNLAIWASLHLSFYQPAPRRIPTPLFRAMSQISRSSQGSSSQDSSSQPSGRPGSNDTAPRASLLGIPAELRVRIYRYVLHSVHCDEDTLVRTTPPDCEVNGDREPGLLKPHHVITLTAIHTVCLKIRTEALPFKEEEHWSRSIYLPAYPDDIRFLSCPYVVLYLQKVTFDLEDDPEHLKAVLDKAALCTNIWVVTLRHGFDNDFEGDKIRGYEGELYDDYIVYFQQFLGLPRPFHITLEMFVSGSSPYDADSTRQIDFEIPKGYKTAFGTAMATKWHWPEGWFDETHD